MRMLTALAAAASAFALMACSQEAPAPAPESTMSDAPMTPPVIAVEDTPTFVQKVAISDMYEIQAARIIIERSTTAAVKDFARSHGDGTHRIHRCVASSARNASRRAGPAHCARSRARRHAAKLA